MPAPHSYDYAVIRIVPRVEREEFINAGVILFCRTARFLAARVELDRERLEALAPGTNAELIQEYLDAIRLVCDGDPRAGAVGKWPQAERFHWLVAPRSTIIQTSPVHTGLCDDPQQALDHLFDKMVRIDRTVHEGQRSSDNTDET
jgi:hypothetical protein